MLEAKRAPEVYKNEARQGMNLSRATVFSAERQEAAHASPFTPVFCRE